MTATQRINAGANVIHFFGHSSNNIYDVDIQEPSLYLNYGKYPMMIAFGCYGGNFAGDNKSFGERFVLVGKSWVDRVPRQFDGGVFDAAGQLWGEALSPTL
jgi:hypothetical protein